MGYRIEKTDFEEALRHAAEYDLALIYEIGGIRLCDTRSLPGTDWTECQEARFFAEDRELHLYEQDGEMTALEIYDDGDDNTIVKRYKLDQRFRQVGKILRVKEYIKYDEDGQAFIALTRLCGIE